MGAKDPMWVEEIRCRHRVSTESQGIHGCQHTGQSLFGGGTTTVELEDFGKNILGRKYSL